MDTLYRGRAGRPFGGVGAFSWTFLLCGEQDRYLRCFEEIIQELQLQPPGFQRLCALRFEELLLSMGRQRLRLKIPSSPATAW